MTNGYRSTTSASYRHATHLWQARPSTRTSASPPFVHAADSYAPGTDVQRSRDLPPTDGSCRITRVSSPPLGLPPLAPLVGERADVSPGEGQTSGEGNAPIEAPEALGTLNAAMPDVSAATAGTATQPLDTKHEHHGTTHPSQQTQDTELRGVAKALEQDLAAATTRLTIAIHKAVDTDDPFPTFEKAAKAIYHLENQPRLDSNHPDADLINPFLAILQQSFVNYWNSHPATISRMTFVKFMSTTYRDSSDISYDTKVTSALATWDGVHFSAVILPHVIARLTATDILTSTIFVDLTSTLQMCDSTALPRLMRLKTQLQQRHSLFRSAPNTAEVPTLFSRVKATFYQWRNSSKRLRDDNDDEDDESDKDDGNGDGKQSSKKRALNDRCE